MVLLRNGYVHDMMNRGGRVQKVRIVYWRDIPAQVIVGTGRRASKVQLSVRFEKAIDICAMRSGARDSDAYLSEWHRGEPYDVEGEAEDVASREAAKIEAEIDDARLRALIENAGRSGRVD